jgi:hypothetical protein
MFITSYHSRGSTVLPASSLPSSKEKRKNAVFILSIRAHTEIVGGFGGFFNMGILASFFF